MRQQLVHIGSRCVRVAGDHAVEVAVHALQVRVVDLIREDEPSYHHIHTRAKYQEFAGQLHAATGSQCGFIEDAVPLLCEQSVN